MENQDNNVTTTGLAGVGAAATTAAGRHCARRRALLLALAASASASAPLKVAVINVAPFGMQDAQGRASGLCMDILDKLSLRSGVRFDPIVTPYPRAVALVAAGEADLIFSLDNPQLALSAERIALVAHEEVILIGRAGTPLRRIADLHGKQIGYIRGANYDDTVMANPYIAKHETISAQQTIDMLLRRRFDAALGTSLALLYALRMAGISRDKLGAPLVLKRPQIWLSYSKRRYLPDVAQRLAKAVDGLRTEGALDALRQRYLDGGAP